MHKNNACFFKKLCKIIFVNILIKSGIFSIINM